MVFLCKKCKTKSKFLIGSGTQRRRVMSSRKQTSIEIFGVIPVKSKE